ncbi:MAG: Universal stress protein [Methanomassiliicoccales archaeon PtaU1.Bin124]|nr:MAG: Universal stress protein [Methanomassiliicoccales archaeon PtaU1.Bin124]
MPENGNVLLATDGKPHSEKATKYAYEYAKLHNATLFIVFVVSPKAEEDKEKVIQDGMRVLEKMKNEAAAHGIKVTTLLEAGNPYETILSASDRVKAEAIIVGTSGKTVLDRVLIGSVSEYVVRNSRCTVIVVK